MITSKAIDILLKGVRAEFTVTIDQAEKQLAAYNSNIYIDASNKTGALFEEVAGYGRQRVEAIQITGVSELQPTEEQQEFIDTSYSPSFITAVEPFKFTRRVKVTRESAERRDTRYQKALNEAAKLQIAAENTKTRHRFDRFNKAFAAVTAKHLFDYGDGAALISAAHPTKVPGGSNQSNLVSASDISPTVIETEMLVLQNQIDDIGEPMPMGGGMKYFVVPPSKVKKAKENIDSEWQIDTANNNINVWRGVGWVLVTSPFLSAKQGGSDTAHFIVDGMYSPLKDVMFRAVTNETWFDENTKTFVHDISFEHKVGAFDYRGIVGNAGA
jgi:hypothetical protein